MILLALCDLSLGLTVRNSHAEMLHLSVRLRYSPMLSLGYKCRKCGWLWYDVAAIQMLKSRRMNPSQNKRMVLNVSSG
jgi:hypothetical protein